MSPRKLRFSVFVIKTYSGTGKRDFNLGLCFCFFRFCSLPRALTSALIERSCLPVFYKKGRSRNQGALYGSKFFLGTVFFLLALLKNRIARPVRHTKTLG